MMVASGKIARLSAEIAMEAFEFGFVEGVLVAALTIAVAALAFYNRRMLGGRWPKVGL